MIMQQLNEKEKNVLDFIIKNIGDNGYSPSIRDIKTALGFRSTSTVHMYLERLEEKGYIQKEEGKSRTLRVEDMAPQGFKVPLLGRVTAGLPALAEQNYEGFINFNASRAEYSQENLFALRIDGESMITAGIMDNDIVIVDKQDFANNGQIVVALVDDEATVKTFYKENGHYRLQPENPDMKPIITNKAEILGRVIACLRFY